MGIIVYLNKGEHPVYQDKHFSRAVEDKRISILIETKYGSGEYEESKENKWPNGYNYNTSLSRCENDSELVWNEDTRSVLLKASLSDKCYVYFDVVLPLAEYIKSQYTGTQGENNLYLHDSTLENGAEDDSYRYAGFSDTTNNFVCFGYDSVDSACPTDYLYRIIGVFGNQVKLIKYDYANSNLLGTDGDFDSDHQPYTPDDFSTYRGTKNTIDIYCWNCSSNDNSVNQWNISNLNIINLNTNFLNNIGEQWSNKIATHTWQVGGNTWEKIGNMSASGAYQNEIVSPSTSLTYAAKVGLLYVSDYGYAAALSSWTTALESYNSPSVTSLNWIYMGLHEWTNSPQLSASNYAFSIHSSGSVYNSYVHYSKAIRPVFYLDSNVAYAGGSGTISSPILIS